jgi:hypothetical protein
MTIKYAEITIIRDLEEESMFDSIGRYFGNEPIITDNDLIIITFDDNTICDIKNEYIDKKFIFGPCGYIHNFPIHFRFDSYKRVAFYTIPDIIDGNYKLRLKDIFKNNINYHKNNCQSSIYNMIYSNYDGDLIFAILRVKSNEEKPRYLLAYNSELFHRSDIIYLIDCMFKHKFINENNNK